MRRRIFIFAFAVLFALTVWADSQNMGTYVENPSITGYADPLISNAPSNITNDPSQPIAIWHFDGNLDDSADDHDGEMMGKITFVQGIKGQAAHFDGNSYINIEAAPDLNAMEEFSIEAWIRLDPGSAEMPRLPLVNKFGSSGFSDDEWILEIQNDKRIYFGTYSGPYGGYQDFYLRGKTVFAPDKWYHIVATFSNSEGVMELYIDGQLDVSIHAQHEKLRDTNQQIQIGGFRYEYRDPWYYFMGEIDELVIWKGRPDTSPPELNVEITYPTEEDTYTSQVSPIEIRGTASDNVVSVSWENTTTGEKGACSGTGNWMCQVPLVGGDNFIKVVAKDSAGSILGSDQINVEYIPLQMVDLSISQDGVTLSKSKPSVKEVVKLSAIVSNEGGADAENVYVRFYSISLDGDKTQIGKDCIIDNLPAGGSNIASLDWSVDNEAQHIEVHVDPPLDSGGMILERDEKNNKAGIINTRYRPSSDAFAFGNYPYSVVPTWLPEWNRKYGLFAHCLGMCATSLVYFYKHDQPLIGRLPEPGTDCNPRHPGIPSCSYESIIPPIWLPPCTTKSLIEYNQLLFYLDGMIHNSMLLLFDTALDPVRDEYVTVQFSDLIKELRSGPQLLFLRGHALIAYAVSYEGRSAKISVYDPNQPLNNNMEIVFDIRDSGLFHMQTYSNDYDIFCIYGGPFSWYLLPPSVIMSTCPVDLIVTDPIGATISKTSTQIPGTIYAELDLDGDEYKDDLVLIPNVLDGSYSIRVVAEQGAIPEDEFTLHVCNGGKLLEIKNVSIEDIPGNGYILDTLSNELTIAAWEDEKNSLAINPSKISVQRDDTFTVNIEVSKITDLFGASFELQFNGDILEATGAKPGDALGSDVVFLNVPSEGKISVAISKKEGDDPFSGSGTLATIDFRAKADGKTEITFDKPKLTLQKADGSPIPDFSELTFAPCEITIGQVSQAMISIVPSDFQVKPGDEFTLEAVVSDIDKLFGASFEIQYDGNILDYVSSSAGDFMGSDVVFFSIKGNNSVNIAISMKAGAEPASGTGALAVIKFKARSAGKLQVSYRKDTLALNHPDGTPISVTVNNGNVTVGEGIIKGDVNNDGNVRSNDAILALRMASGLIESTPEQRQAADMNDDGMVKSNDAILILREAAGLAAPGINALPTATRKATATLPESHGVAGERLTIPLKVDNANLLAGGDICITYDDTVLWALGVESNLMLVSNIRESGRVYISFADVQGLREDTLADIQFGILRDSVSSLEFDTVELYQPDASPLTSGRLNGRFSSWAIPPERSDLMQNYPNPSNPETWIPYQLRESGEVTVRIHSITGELIRELKLGYKSAGLYVTKDRAAYWDGRTESGERAASGVYFYTISAGDFRETKKLIILK